MQQYPYHTADEQPTVFTNGSNAVLNTAESAQTVVQQLKAEIAAFANEPDSLYIKDCDLANAKDLVERMRQLSAV
jgi:chemotaxis regulatin CheY-phosphate phosphatase CheZ